MRFPLDIGIELPGLHGFFDRLVLVVVTDLIERQLPLALYRFLIKRLCLEVGLDGVIGAVMAFVEPGVDFERLTRNQNGALADDGAARLVGHFRDDGELVVLVAVQLLGGRGVDEDLDLAVGTDRYFVFEDELRLLAAPTPPRRNRTPATPLREAGIPIVIGGEPPVAVAVHPVPAAHRIPAARMAFAHDLVLDDGAGNRSAEVILCFDGGSYLVAELDRFLRRFNLHLEFRLLVFLDAEAAAAVVA